MSGRGADRSLTPAQVQRLAEIEAVSSRLRIAAIAAVERFRDAVVAVADGKSAAIPAEEFLLLLDARSEAYRALTGAIDALADLAAGGAL